MRDDRIRGTYSTNEGRRLRRDGCQRYGGYASSARPEQLGGRAQQYAESAPDASFPFLLVGPDRACSFR